jgi:DNA-binding NarL/FixJ family response regulator
VVVLTGDKQDHLIEPCRQLGADAVFDKSEDVEKLVEFCKTHANNLDSMRSPMGLITTAADFEVAADFYAS